MRYEEPNMEIIVIKNIDVITTSPNTGLDWGETGEGGSGGYQQ